MKLHPFVLHGLPLLIGLIVLGAVTDSVAEAELRAEPGPSWIVGADAARTGKMAVSLSVSPRPLVYGRVVDAVIEVANGTTESRQVQVRALLGEVAFFVEGDSRVRFENPEQPEQQRKLEWPVLELPAGARGQVGFRFLVSWDVSGDLYIEVEAHDVAGGAAPAAAHLQETPQYPAGTGGVLAQYGYIGVSLGVFLAVVLAVRQASRRMSEGAGIRRSLWGLMAGAGLVTVVISLSIMWSELEPWFGWPETNCEILDVRYSVDTSTTSTGTGQYRRSTTFELLSASLALRFEGPDGPMVSSGYRKQSGIGVPEDLAGYVAGDSTECYYDPADPGWVIVERDLKLSSLLIQIFLILVGALLIGFGLKSRAA